MTIGSLLFLLVNILDSKGARLEILVLMAYAQNPPLNVHNDVSSVVRSLTFSLCLYLHPNFMYASRHYVCFMHAAKVAIHKHCLLDNVKFSCKDLNVVSV